MFFDYLCHAANTLFGMYAHKYSTEWDAKLSYLLDNAGSWDSVEISTSKCCLKIAYRGVAYHVWIENRWYAYGSLYELNGYQLERHHQSRPRFSTMRRLHLVASSLIAARNAAEQAWIKRLFQETGND
ncbi:hypothetical protein F2C03_06850 [Salmonella enterica]|nr:hypothetical protein [Salmonella enterica]